MGDSPCKNPAKLPLVFQRLKEMGINTAMVFDDGDPEVPARNHFPYYVENIVNRGLCLKWNSRVTNWDAFVTQWRKDGSPKSALVRDYCLDDPQWRQASAAEVRRVVEKNAPHHPVAYNLRDELSTTFSANPFDYDFNRIALDHFRQWLREQYPTLEALNVEWQTRFASWDEVTPFTTDEIKNRTASGEALPRGHPDWQALESLKFDASMARQNPTRWNFSPWADFRTYMDISLAGALDDLRHVARGIDPQTPVGIEGAQMPDAFGGYDLWRLSQAVDWIEPYDIANSRAIFGSFMPDRNIITTVFESDANHARRRLWHLLLEGDRGCIVWWSEDCIDWQSADYPLTPKGKTLAPVLREMTSPLARLFLRAQPEGDPVYILYSQPSIQVDWLLESTVDGSTWLRRFSSFEASHNEMARNRDGWLKAFEDLGCAPQFVSTEQVEAGRLRGAEPAALVLPECYALSDKTLGEIGVFLRAAPAHEVFWDVPPGLFDEHGKLRSAPNFVDAGQGAHRRAGDGAVVSAPGHLDEYPATRLSGHGMDWAGWIASQLRTPRQNFGIPAAARVRIHRYRAPENHGLLLAFERNIAYQMSENLAQAGGNEALEKSIELNATLPSAAHVYDLRGPTYIGFTNRIHFVLDPWQPSLFAALKEKLPAPSLIEELTD